MKPVRLRARARQDVEAALDHYREEAGASVALGFVDALETGLRHIGEHPASGSPRFAHDLGLPELRCWPLGGYPQIIFYVVAEDVVDVWRVLHGARDIPSSLRIE